LVFLSLHGQQDAAKNQDAAKLALIANSLAGHHEPGLCEPARWPIDPRRGYHWTDRYPLITDLPQDATIDGGVVVCDAMGVADFELLHSREHDRQAFLYAFDLLELDSLDLRPFPLERGKDQLRKLLLGCMTGIKFNEHL
jgi:hypothetical protein